MRPFARDPQAWSKWRALARQERRATLAAALLVPLCAVSVRVAGLSRTMRWVASPPRAILQPPGEAGVARWVRALERVRWHSPWPGSCLSRSLALQWLLGRAGIRTELKIGVARHEASLAAHAWVEWEGRVLNGGTDVEQAFAPLAHP